MADVSHFVVCNTPRINTSKKFAFFCNLLISKDLNSIRINTSGNKDLKSPRINTSGSKDLKSFIINTSKKQGRGEGWPSPSEISDKKTRSPRRSPTANVDRVSVRSGGLQASTVGAPPVPPLPSVWRGSRRQFFPGRSPRKTLLDLHGHVSIEGDTISPNS
jgi:hypothetical protein